MDERSKYAAAWPDRADGGFDFRLSGNPEARYLLVPPRNYDPAKSYELWVCVFGAPSTSEQALAEWWRYARQRDAFLLAPHGSTRLAARSTMATWNLDKDPEEIVKMVAEATRRFNVRKDRMAIMGSSSGGRVVWSIVSKRPDLFRFAAINSTPWDEAEPGIDRKGLWQAGRRMRMFYGMGTADPAYSKQAFDTATRRLLQAGFELTTMRLDHVGHDPRPFLDAADRLYAELETTWGEKPRRWSLSLAGTWKARMTAPLPPLRIGPDHHGAAQYDPGISPAALASVSPTFDDRRWQDVKVPSYWNAWAGNWRASDGEAVLRKRFIVPARLSGHDLRVRLGYIDDTDKTYLNGELIGTTDEGAPYWEYAPRIYRIPGRLVRAGENVLAVRVFDQRLNGGIGGVSDSGILISEE